MLEVLGVSIISGAIAAGVRSRKRKDLKTRIINILLACNVVTKTHKQVFFPKVVAIDPKDYGKRIVIRLPDGYDSSKLIDTHWNAIEEALGKEISIEYDKFLYIDIYDNEMQDFIEYVYEDRNDLKVAFAENGKGTYYIDLEKDAPHYLGAGATGMGKSTLVHVILTTLSLRKNCPYFYLADLKDGLELSLYRDLAHTKGFAETLKELDTMLLTVLEEMSERAAIMKAKSQVKWRGKRILVVVDEMIDLYITRNDPEVKLKARIKHMLAMLTAKGRAFGITVMAFTQRPDAQVIDGIIKTNINNKICFRVVDSDQSQIVLGRGNSMAAHLPEIPGRCLMFLNTKKDIAQVYLLERKEAEKLLKEVPRIERNIAPSQNTEMEEDTFELTRIGLSHD